MPSEFRTCFASLVGCLIAMTASGHDLGSIAHPSNTGTESPWAVRTTAPTDAQTRSIIVNASKWPVGYTLKACFYGGGAPIRQAIMASATKWLEGGGVGLRIDFGPVPGLRSCSATPGPNNRYEDVRIDFRGIGHWSYIGVDSHRYLGPSMNLQNFDQLPQFDDYSASIVLHEFGHALGLHHEHQSPGSPCDGEFDLAAVRQLTGWNDAQIKTNFAALEKNSSLYDWSPYDPKSIMMYSLPPQVFVKGPASRCWIPQNYKISDEDRRAIRKAYPAMPGVAAGAAIADRTRGADAAISNPNVPSDVRDRAWIQKLLVENE